MALKRAEREAEAVGLGERVEDDDSVEREERVEIKDGLMKVKVGQGDGLYVVDTDEDGDVIEDSVLVTAGDEETVMDVVAEKEGDKVALNDREAAGVIETNAVRVIQTDTVRDRVGDAEELGHNEGEEDQEGDRDEIGELEYERKGVKVPAFD